MVELNIKLGYVQFIELIEQCHFRFMGLAVFRSKFTMHLILRRCALKSVQFSLYFTILCRHAVTLRRSFKRLRQQISTCRCVFVQFGLEKFSRLRLPKRYK